MNNDTVYKFTVKTTDLDILHTYQKAFENSVIVWEIVHNFHRKFKYLEGKSQDFYDGVDLVLEELVGFINEHKNED